MMSVCRPHPVKSLTEPFYTDAVYGLVYPDTDTDDKNSLNVIQCVPFLSGYAYTDADTETWNSGLLITRCANMLKHGVMALIKGNNEVSL